MQHFYARRRWAGRVGAGMRMGSGKRVRAAGGGLWAVGGGSEGERGRLWEVEGEGAGLPAGARRWWGMTSQESIVKSEES
jgi:hypothetical protein